MPEANAYEAVVWVIENNKAIWKFGMRSYHLMRATNFAYAACEYWAAKSPDGGYITVSDVSSAKELERINFGKMAMAAKTAA